MRIVWDPKAKASRTQIANYIRKEFGAKRKIRYLQDIREAVDKLRYAPNIGQIDPLFADRSQTYRSIVVNGLNKLVYRIDGDTINIVAFWDTRSEPEGQAEQVK